FRSAEGVGVAFVVVGHALELHDGQLVVREVALAQIRALLENHDAEAGAGELAGHDAARGTRPDDHEVHRLGAGESRTRPGSGRRAAGGGVGHKSHRGRYPAPSSPRRAIAAACSAARKARAWIVIVGWPRPEVTKLLPSTRKRLGTSWVRCHRSTTDDRGSLPMRQVPRRCTSG